MSDVSIVKETCIKIKNLEAFIKLNKSVDFRRENLQNISQSTSDIDSYNWKGIEAVKTTVLEQLKAYQRVLRVLPENIEADRSDKIARSLLKLGFASALQIANSPKKTFIEKAEEAFFHDSGLIEQAYQRAIACRKAVALKYMNIVQQSEPHARAAGI